MTTSTPPAPHGIPKFSDLIAAMTWRVEDTEPGEALEMMLHEEAKALLDCIREQQAALQRLIQTDDIPDLPDGGAFDNARAVLTKYALEKL